jgi:hypothetical protein
MNELGPCPLDLFSLEADIKLVLALSDVWQERKLACRHKPMVKAG